jgi:hypothetical protein
MKHIFFLEGLEEWHSVLTESKCDSSDCSITLVSFKPNQSNEEDKRKLSAHEKVQKMFHSCFHTVNHESIDAAMKTFPTMAIFLSLRKKASRKWKQPPSKDQMIFDDNNSRQVHCLCAVNYF